MAQLKNTTINDTGFLTLPVGTTAQRPSSPQLGDVRYNTSLNEVEYWNGSTWSEALFNFTTFTFTNAGKVGRSGPTLAECLASYNTSTNPWLNNTNFFNVSGGIQIWTVPKSGLYRIEARGAQGGDASSTNANNTPIQAGGRGARIRGDVYLRKGEKINIIVGHRGMGYNTFLLGFNTPTDTSPPVTERAGGGGGSFVWSRDSGLPLVIAGGGGAASGDPGNGQPGKDATTTTVGTTSGSNTGFGGTNAQGGRSIGSQSGRGSAGSGAGFLEDGRDDPIRPPAQRNGLAIIRFTNAGLGGNSFGQNLDGGFGGGGTDVYTDLAPTATDSEGTGGGGGYTGGAGGNSSSDDAGGGGGSFITAYATNVATSNGSWQNIDNVVYEAYPSGPVINLSAFNTGDGRVIITRL